MTYDDALKIMAILRTAYPAYYRTAGREEATAAARLWAEMFSGEDIAVVVAAVKVLMASDEKGFPPHIGAVKAAIRRLSAPPILTEAEAWAKVRHAVESFCLDPRPEFDALPEDIRRIVGSARTLADWAEMDIAQFESVVASNFQRSWRAMQASKRDLDEARALGFADTARLPEGRMYDVHGFFSG